MRKGFTLIELLAVIVILAIIALIAIPQFAKVIDNAKMNAGARSVEGHIDSVNTEIAKKMLRGSDFLDGEISSLSSLDISVKGNVTCTSDTLKSNTVVSASNCSANGYIYSYNIENGAYILSGSKGSKANIYASANGRLHVEGSKLMNSKNQEFRLMGASNGVSPQDSHAVLKPGNKMYTEKSFATLKSWGANGFRIFINGNFWVGTEEQYSAGMVNLKETIENLIKNDMYVILNWQGALNSTDDPNAAKAKKFFSDISNYYKNDYHIIYEIWNEPHASLSWATIKACAEDMIPIIRANAPDSIILVGTPNNDHGLNEVIGNELNFKNIMYTNHTYVNDLTTQYFDNLKAALESGLPIFESECGATESGTPVGDYIRKAHFDAFVSILNKYNISYMYFCWEAGFWAYNIVDHKAFTWDEELPESMMRKSGIYLKHLLKDDLRTTSYLMIENFEDEGSYYRASEWKDKIISVSFKNKINIPNNAVVKWDLSALRDNTVVGYLTPSKETGMYDLYIAANGYVNLPINSRSLFRDLTNVKSYDFKYAKTDYVTNMTRLFMNNKKIESLDLSSFDASSLRYIGTMFGGCVNLKSIDFTGWNPPLEDNMDSTFSGCSKLENLDLRGFDVSKVNNFTHTFYNCSSLRTLNISTWKPNKIGKLKNSFYNLSSVNEIDLSGFTTFVDGYISDGVFDNVNNSALIKTGNADFKALMKTRYPSLNFE